MLFPFHAGFKPTFPRWLICVLEGGGSEPQLSQKIFFASYMYHSHPSVLLYFIFTTTSTTNAIYLITTFIFIHTIKSCVCLFFQPVFHSVLLFLLLRFLEARQNGGDVRDVCCCCPAGKHSRGKSNRHNTDVQLEEDEDVKTERENVDTIMSSGPRDEVRRGRDHFSIRILTVANFQLDYDMKHF